MPPEPDFTWDSRLNRYRDARGRLASRAAVREALDQTIDAANERIRADALALQTGTINLPEWQLRTEADLKTIHVMSTAAAAGGWAQVTPRDWSSAGNRIKAQYGYLERFARQIETGEQPLDGRFLARAQMYAAAGSGTYEAVLRRIDLATGRVLAERRRLHSLNPCPECLTYAALDWQPPGVLPDIGADCQCFSNCRCAFERRFAKAGKPARAAVRVPTPPNPATTPAPRPAAARPRTTP